MVPQGSRRYRRRIALVSAAVLIAASSSGRFGAAVAQGPAQISPDALAQIDALIREKETRSAVEQRIDSQLLYERRLEQGQPVAPGVDYIETDLPYASDGHVVVDVKATIAPALLTSLSAIGVEVVSSDSAGGMLRAHINIDQVAALAALPDVAFVQPQQGAMTSREPSSRRPDRARRAARVTQLLASAAAAAGAQPNFVVSGPPTGQGSRSSEGDVTHLAFAARGAFGVDGTGVKIGVLSDGVTNLAASQAAGDLGPVTVLPGQAGSGDEGTAMLEIIHDLAPGAQLYFATAFGGITSFANNIRALQAAGCNIIVDDVFYFVETPFQDGQAPSVISNTNGGVVIQAVNDVTAAGALYFSSAGNSGNLTGGGTSGVWEGDFLDGGATGAPLPLGNRLHDFGGGQTFDVLTVPPAGAPLNLYWSDPLGGSANDYDLFRLNSTGTAVSASSTNIQNGTQDPYEAVSAGAAGARLVIVKKAASADRFLHLATNRGRLSIATSGETHGHNSAADAFGVAATPAVGPYPQPFSSANVIETFSSDGLRRIFFQANGTPITPGNFGSTGGLVRQKPDITAADGVSVTGVGGFPSPFFGTSAAAPHAAAIAALLLSGNGALTPGQIRTALLASAIDIMTPGVDRNSGAGIIMATGAMAAAGIPGTALLTAMSADVSDDPGNGDGHPAAGEGARLIIPLTNFGVATATNISATLTSSTPGITLQQPTTHTYPDLAPSATSNGTPYRFTVASDFACPATASFVLTVTSNGGPSPRTFPFTVPIGPGPFTITTVLDGTAPSPSAGVTTSTGLQNSRIFRDGIVSSCAAPKVFPGTTAPGNRQYDGYAFNTCANSLASCVTVTLQGASAINLFTAAYVPSFNPANIVQNWVADPGASAASRTYSFGVAGGAGSFAIDVHEVNPGGAIGTQYTLSVAGACAGACAPPNHPPVAKAKNVTVSADSTCTAPASIDDGSYDPDGDPLTITQSPPGPYPLGVTAVLLTVRDPSGATSQATANVTVVDDTPPTVTGLAASPASLWPPNHQMVDVAVTYAASDGCSSVQCVLTVSSNQPINGPGDGNTSPDWEVVDAHHVRLRAERAGTGDRLYQITLTCTDGVGNKTVQSVTVVVPRNR